MNVEHLLSRTNRRAFLVVAATAGAAAALVSSAGGSAQSSGGRAIMLFEASKASTFGFVDNPPKTTRNDPHASIGDVLAFSNPVFDASRARRLGTSAAQCTATRPGRISSATYTCYGTFALKDGMIAVAALQVGEPKTLVLAVVGGTGAYDGARGTMVSRRGRDGAEDTITLVS